jgi:two-component system, OmpR family, sensor histidine kinase CiaH
MPNRARIRIATVVYWILLSYIIAALVWWFISLQHQNTAMAEFKTQQLNVTIDSTKMPSLYQTELAKINKEKEKNLSKYIGEGSIFFLLILVGASFVFRSVRRQLRLQQQQQNFMMAVTHELKTPISVARLNLETLQKHNLDPEKQKKLIRMTLEETNRLNSLTNNILVASQLEGRGYKIAKEDLNLSDLLKDRVQDFRSRFPDRQFNENIVSDIDIKGDALLLQMMINNLIENAIKYSPKEKTVTCHLFRKDGLVHLSVTDEGEGIPGSEKKKIFYKFYRVGNESTRKAQGTGLGLYLCKIIAKDHNGDISVTDNEPMGSNFTIIFYN